MAKQNAKGESDKKKKAQENVKNAVQSGAAYKKSSSTNAARTVQRQVKQDEKVSGNAITVHKLKGETGKALTQNKSQKVQNLAPKLTRAGGGRSGKAGNTTRKVTPTVSKAGNSGAFGSKRLSDTDGRQLHEERKKRDLQTLTQNSIRWHQTNDTAERAQLKRANDSIRAQYGLQYQNGKTYLPTASGRKYLSKAVDRYTGHAAAADTYDTQAEKQARYDEIQSEINRLQEENPYLLSREASDRKLASVPYFISHPSKIGTAMQGAGKYDAMNDEQKKDADALYAYYQTLVNERNALATTGALKTLGGAAANTAGNILEVPENIVRLAKAGVNNAVGETAGLFGLDKVRDFYKTDAENTMKNSFVGNAMQKVNDWAQPVGMTQKSQELSGQVARMLPGIAAGGIGAAGLGNAGLATIFADSTASSARQALNEGANMNRAIMYGVGSGAVEVGTEKLFGGIPGLNEGLVKLGGSNPILGKAADIAGEGLEEAASTFINPYLQRATYNPNAQNATARELWDSAKGGMLVSGIMQGANGIANRVGSAKYGTTPAEPTTSIHDANADMQAADAMYDRLHPETAQTDVQTAPSEITQPMQENAQAATQQADINPKLTKAGVTPESSVGAAEGGFDPYSKMVNDYGAIPEGENPARVVDVPQSTNGEDRVRRGARTFMESGITTDEMIPSFEQEVANGTFSYNVKTDKRALDNAVKTINKKGWQGAYEQWQDVTDGRRTASKDDIVLAETMYSAAVKSGDTQTAMRLAAEIAAEGTRAGQEVQAIKLLKKSTPEGQLYYLQKAVEKIQQEYQSRFDKLDRNAEKKAEKTAKKGIPGAEVAEQHGITLNEDLVQEFLDAPNEDARKEVVNKIYDDIANQIPATAGDRLNAWRYFAMLGNPRTHIRNIIGNFIYQIPHRVSNEVSALGQKFLPQEKRTRALHTDSEAVKFAKQDFANVKEELGGSSYTSDISEIKQRQKLFPKPLQKLMDANGWALGAEDMVFKKISYVDSMASLITARGWDANNLTAAQLNEAREHAKADALKATFNDASALANALNRIEKTNKATEMIIGGLVPFKKTPTNIVKRSFELSPVGLLKAATYDAVQVKRGNMDATQMIDHIGQGLTGTGLAAVGAFMAAQGIFSVGASDDDKEANLDAAMGQQEYAINIGGKSYTIDWAAPAIVPLAIGGELYNALSQQYDDETTAYNQALATISRMFEPLLNMTMLSGVGSTVSSAAYSGSNPTFGILNNIAQNYVGQVVPTALGQVARTVDNTRRSTYADKTSPVPSSIQKFMQRQANKIPGLSQNQPAYTDVWGREQKNGPDNVFARAAYNFLSPGYLADAKSTQAEKALKDLYQATGDNSVLPSKPQKYYKTEDGTKKFLSASDYSKLTSEGGKIALDALDKLTKSEAYKGMTNDEKIEAVSDVYKYAKAVAANKTYGKELEGTMQKIKDAADENISVGDYIAFNNSMSAIKDRNTGSASSEEDNLRDMVDLLESGTFKNMSEAQKDYLFASTGRSAQYNPYHESDVEKSAENNDYYKGLNEADKLYFRSFANEYEDAVKNGKKLDGWIAKAKLASDNGVVEPYQYVAFQHALLYANTDNNDNYKQSEVTAAINSLSGLTQQQKAYLWQSANKQWKPGKNPFGSATVYWPEAKATDGSAGAKIEKRVGAMMGSGK